MREIVTHTFGPVFDAHSRVLVLGSIPSPKSREMGFYYGHPQNRFWSVLAAVFGEELPRSVEERRAFALRNRIALWDVLASCSIEGAEDASIREPEPSDLTMILRVAPIRAIFTTGQKADALYKKYCEPATGMPSRCLPSTSPANRRISTEMLLRAYGAIREVREA